MNLAENDEHYLLHLNNVYTTLWKIKFVFLWQEKALLMAISMARIKLLKLSNKFYFFTSSVIYLLHWVDCCWMCGSTLTDCNRLWLQQMTIFFTQHCCFISERF